MLIWQLHLFSNKDDMIHLERSVVRPDYKIMREALYIGLPQFLINLCACLVAIIVTRSMTTYGGDTAVGAFGISNRLVLFVVMVV
jgi:Na+-driven multidrug efflux pump